jgi:hypothetical protein
MIFFVFTFMSLLSVKSTLSRVYDIFIMSLCDVTMAALLQLCELQMPKYLELID